MLAQKGAPGAGDPLRYTVKVGAGLDEATVQLCPGNAHAALAIRRLAPGQRRFRDRLLFARRDDTGEALPRTRTGVRLGRLPPGVCVTYAVGLTAGQPAGFHLGEGRLGEAVLAPPALWLWRDPDDTAPLELGFDLAPGVEASVPWPRLVDGRYRVPTSSFRYLTRAAFGRLRLVELPVAGGLLRVAHLGAPFRGGDALLHEALVRAARAVAAPLGRLPVSTLQVLLLGIEGDTVRFGATARGGGAGIGLLVGRDVDARALEKDWVIVHELTHFLHPHLSFEDTWFYEGLATYYGPVLRVRAGMITPDEARAELERGFTRGARSLRGATLREDSRSMREKGNYGRVYWSGAALLLLTDLALQALSDGPRSLDDLVRALWVTCERAQAARPLATRLTWIDPQLALPLQRLMARYLDSEAFPEVEALTLPVTSWKHPTKDRTSPSKRAAQTAQTE